MHAEEGPAAASGFLHHIVRAWHSAMFSVIGDPCTTPNRPPRRRAIACPLPAALWHWPASGPTLPTTGPAGDSGSF